MWLVVSGQLLLSTERRDHEIADQVGRIQDSTGLAVQAIEGIAARVREISGSAASIAASVEQQGAATREIVRNVSLAADGTSEATGNVAGMARAAEETGTVADEVLRAADELAARSGQLSSEMGRFLGRIRAA